MCLPLVGAGVAGAATLNALGTAAIASSVIGTGLSAYSAYQQADSQNKANEYNAASLRRNAEVANMQANQAIEQGRVDEKAHRMKVNQLIGTQRAAGGASGALIDTGTNLDIQKDTAGFGELDSLTIRNNAARTAWAYQNQAVDYGAGANLSTMRNTNPYLSTGVSLLSGASNLAGQLYQYKKVS